MKDINTMEGIAPQLREFLSQNVGSAINASAEEYGDAFNHVTVLTIPAFTQAVTSAALCFGKKIYDFPKGYIKCERALMQITIATPVSTTTGEIGLGSVIGAGAQATIGAAGATMEDIIDGTATSETSTAGSLTTVNKTCESDNPDGHTTAVDLFLNVAGTWEASENATISGKVTIFWQFLGT